MNKTTNRRFRKAIREKYKHLVALSEEVEGLIDYLEVVKARAHDKHELRLTHEDVMKRYRVK